METLNILVHYTVSTHRLANPTMEIFKNALVCRTKKYVMLGTRAYILIYKHDTISVLVLLNIINIPLVVVAFKNDLICIQITVWGQKKVC